MSRFCTQCGSSIEENAAFCGNCGARQEPPQPAAAGPPPAAPPKPVQAEAGPVVTPASPAAPPKSGNLFLKVVAIVLGLIALVTVAAIGSCIYIGYRVKRKVEHVAQDIKKETAKGRGESTTANTVPVLPCPAVEAAQSADFRRAAAAASIPLKPGLTLVNIWTNKALGGRDVEVLTHVQSVDDNTVSVQAARTEPGSQASTRTLCIADLIDARQYETSFGTGKPDTIAGATMFSMPQSVFGDWKAARPAQLTYFEASQFNGGRYTVGSNQAGQLNRAEPDDVPYSAIVNGERKDLPAIHVKGQLGDMATEAYVLDDPADPITLSWEMRQWNFHVRYMKIDFPVEKKIEQQIAQTGCAAVYGIYFDFDSAKLRPESGPALKEVASALDNNPNWKVKIEGHTDNVGGDAYNQTLSARRADSVRGTLVEQYHVTTDRLTSAGFGASQPKATNDTPEGRALNRRVEVCRQ